MTHKRFERFRDQLIAAPLKLSIRHQPYGAGGGFRDQLIAAPLKLGARRPVSSHALDSAIN